jgi:hypothetical protein
MGLDPGDGQWICMGGWPGSQVPTWVWLGSITQGLETPRLRGKLLTHTLEDPVGSILGSILGSNVVTRSKAREAPAFDPAHFLGLVSPATASLAGSGELRRAVGPVSCLCQVSS